MPDPRNQRLDRRADAARRMITSLGRDGSEWEPLDLLRLKALEAEIAHVRSVAVHGIREAGYTDTEIAAALGVSQQAVTKRWPSEYSRVGSGGRYRTPQQH